MNAPIRLFLARFADAHEQPIVADEPEPVAETVILAGTELEARLEAASLEAVRASDASREEEIATLREAHRIELTRAVADAKVLRFAEEGATVAGSIDEAFTALRATISGQIAAALRPLLAEALAEKARTAIVEALDHILADADHPSIVVKGPAEFIAAIRAKRASDASLAYIAEETIDVAVVAGATMIETRLGAALTALSETPAHG